MSGWSWDYEGYDPEQEGLREALGTVGNGYFATRGAAPESTADGVHYPGTYAAGVYNRRTTEISGQEVANESLVNLPNWLVLTFRIGDGPWFDIDDVDVLEYEQSLDLRCALLVRRLRFRDGAGRTTGVVQRRFAHMAFRHAAALETTIVPEDWSGTLQVRSALDGTVENRLVERYRDLAGDHLAPLRASEIAPDSVLLEVETNQSHVRIAMAARTTARRDGSAVTVQRSAIGGDASVGQDLQLSVTEGAPVTVEKIVTIFTGRDPAVSEPADSAERWLGRLGGFEDLLPGHATAWRRLWARFHVVLEDTRDADDPAGSLGVVRLHVLHLLQTVSPNSLGLDVGVPPRGLHGEAYRGHILWDELFVFPLLNLRMPIITRSLLGYRHRRLQEARQAAREAGFGGAMYPWQSGSDGREESQRLHLNPRSGRWIPDPTHRQRHVGAAIAYNVWQYYQATGDREFIVHHGAEMLLEIARFWASIATYDRSRDRFEIRGVMGPDEFHSGYPDGPERGIDNNAYTNVMAVWVLLRALETLDLSPVRERDELLDALGIHSDELERWEVLTRKMFVPFHDDGIISQFEGYEHLRELDWEAYRRRYGDIHRLDRILEAEDDSVNRYRASKQADVLMLFYLLSADELRQLLGRLGYDLEPEWIPKNIDYYLARTSHGSTLSAVVHSWVLARAHRERAMDLFLRALESDVADIQGGTTAEGIHLAAMSGSVDLLQRCFAGLETRGDRLVFDPYWPEPLGPLEFSINYRELDLTVCVTGDVVRVAAGPGRQPPIEVECNGQVVELRPGSQVELAT